jgi:hypothetical protein
MTKNLLNKYVWLVETIYKAKRITFEEINEKWLENDMSEGVELALRTFHKWRIAVEEMFGLVIECERKGGYHYYIENASEVRSGSLRSWLLNTISVSNLLIENQSMKSRIVLENIPSGQEYLSAIIKAMKQNNAISITYQSYWREESNTFNVEPYCVKLFKQRWYMVARSPYYNKVMIYALDRIHDLERLEDESFKMPDDFDAEAFFSNFYGIIAPSDAKPEKVTLKVSAGQANYLRSLPLHSSQMETERTDEFSIFQLYLCPEFDFQQALLSMGEDVEVLEPAWLRNEIASMVRRMWTKYKPNAK